MDESTATHQLSHAEYKRWESVNDHHDRAADVREDPRMLSQYRANIGGSIFILMVVLGGVLAWLGLV